MVRAVLQSGSQEELSSLTTNVISEKGVPRSNQLAIVGLYQNPLLFASP